MLLVRPARPYYRYYCHYVRSARISLGANTAAIIQIGGEGTGEGRRGEEEGKVEILLSALIFLGQSNFIIFSMLYSVKLPPLTVQ